MKIIIDATGANLGRTSSFVAKQALLGHEIVIVNAEKAIVSGKPKMIADAYTSIRVKGGTSQKGPNFPSRPEFIFKRTIRGMLSYKQERGRAAFKRVMCYQGVPQEFANAEKILMRSERKGSSMTLEQLSGRLK